MRKAKGKIILIEGTDCSGKEVQSNLLLTYLNSIGINAIKMSFPDYDSPTGRIVGGPYLGKEYICKGWFPEKAANVDARVSSLYYGADFLYHLDKMKTLLDSGTWIILDRYFYSSFAHQGGKITNKQKRFDMYKWLEKLEFDLLGLIDPDMKIFLHMPYEYSCILKQSRKETADQLEADEKHLRNAEKAYKEIAQLYNFKTVECVKNRQIKSIEQIHEDVLKVVKAEFGRFISA